jgi:hypothetical protein
VETNPAFGRFRRWKEQRPDFFVNIPECDIVRDQRLFDVRQAFFQGRICKQFVPQADKSADNVHAHGDGSWTVEDGGCHNCAMFRESERRVFSVRTAASRVLLRSQIVTLKIPTLLALIEAGSLLETGLRSV